MSYIKNEAKKNVTITSSYHTFGLCGVEKAESKEDLGRGSASGIVPTVCEMPKSLVTPS